MIQVHPDAKPITLRAFRVLALSSLTTFEIAEVVYDSSALDLPAQRTSPSSRTSQPSELESALWKMEGGGNSRSDEECLCTAYNVL